MNEGDTENTLLSYKTKSTNDKSAKNGLLQKRKKQSTTKQRWFYNNKPIREFEMSKQYYKNVW